MPACPSFLYICFKERYDRFQWLVLFSSFQIYQASFERFPRVPFWHLEATWRRKQVHLRVPACGFDLARDRAHARHESGIPMQTENKTSARFAIEEKWPIKEPSTHRRQFSLCDYFLWLSPPQNRRIALLFPCRRARARSRRHDYICHHHHYHHRGAVNWSLGAILGAGKLSSQSAFV